MKNKYILFNNMIKDILCHSNPIDYNGNAFIELYCQAVFTDDYFLQLTWKNNRLEWYRTTWLKKEDRQLVDKWFDEFDEDNQSFTFTLLKEDGVGDLDLLKEVLKKIDSLVIKPVFQGEMLGRDGEFIVLEFGTVFSTTSLAWHTCHTPKEWTALDELLELLAELNKKLVPNKKEEWFVDYNFETNNGNIDELYSWNKKKKV